MCKIPIGPRWTVAGWLEVLMTFKSFLLIWVHAFTDCMAKFFVSLENEAHSVYFELCPSTMFHCFLLALETHLWVSSKYLLQGYHESRLV